MTAGTDPGRRHRATKPPAAGGMWNGRNPTQSDVDAKVNAVCANVHIPEADREAASAYVARNAVDDYDAQLLLDALGLTPPGEEVTPSFADEPHIPRQRARPPERTTPGWAWTDRYITPRERTEPVPSDPEALLARTAIEFPEHVVPTPCATTTREAPPVNADARHTAS